MRALILFLTMTVCASAHDWYPPQCCSGHDCFAIAESDLVPMPGEAYIVKASGKIAPKVEVSQDGRWHLCTKTGKIDGPPVCLFRPAPSY